MKYIIAFLFSFSFLACGSLKPVPETTIPNVDSIFVIKTEIKKELDTALMQEVLSEMLTMLDSSYVVFIRDYYVDKASALVAQAGWEYTRDSLAADFKKRLKTTLKNCGSVKTAIIYRPDSSLSVVNLKLKDTIVDLRDSIMILRKKIQISDSLKENVESTKTLYKNGNWVLAAVLFLLAIYSAFFLNKKSKK
jgi:hypothetical protein